MITAKRILGKKVVDVDGKEIGFLKDLVIKNGKETEIVELVINNKKKIFKIKPNVKNIAINITINSQISKLNTAEVEKDDLMLKKHCLESQVLNLNNRKVLRINDVIINKRNGKFVISEALYYETPFKPMRKRIKWKFLEPIVESNTTLSERLKEIPATIITSMMKNMTEKKRIIIFKLLDDEKAGEVLSELDENTLLKIINEIEEQRVARLIEVLPPNKAAKILRQLRKEKQGNILSFLKMQSVKVISELLRYPKNSVGSVMNTEIIKILEKNTVSEVIDMLRAKKPNESSPYYLYIVRDDKRLVGVVSLRTLITSEPNQKMGDVMTKNPITVNVYDKKSKVLKKLLKYRFLALPVVDDNNRLMGIVQAKDILPKLAFKKK